MIDGWEADALSTAVVVDWARFKLETDSSCDLSWQGHMVVTEVTVGL